MSELVSHAATVLGVIDMERSVDFYTNKLSFTLTFTWGEPVNYSVLKRGDVSIHLTHISKGSQRVPQHTSLYIFVSDVDVIHKDIVEKGGTPSNLPDDQEYAMRDFDISDPDGYIITFGKGS